MNFDPREKSFNSEQYDALRQEIRELVMRVTDGPFEGDDIERLNALLQHVPQAREWYVEECCLQCGLIWNESQHPRDTFSGEYPILNVNEEMSDLLFEASQSLGAISEYRGPVSASHDHGYCRDIETSSLTHGSGLNRLSLKLAVPSLAMVGCFWAVLAYLIFFNRSDYAGHFKGRDVSPVATLTAEKECVWQDDAEHKVPRVGQQFGAESLLVLRSGMARLTFADGAVVHLEGPSRFVVQSAKGGLLESGKLLAQVPRRTIGFCVTTSNIEIVDLGTEFGVRADAQNVTEVQVFRGLAEVVPSVNAAKDGGPVNSLRLTAGQAVVSDAQGIGAITKAGEVDQFIAALAQVGQQPSLAAEGRIDVDFSTDPGWTGTNNTSNGNDYGYRANSNVAGGKIGEVGGTFARIKSKESYYADTHLSQTFTLNDTLTASGKFDFNTIDNWSETGDSGLFIGYFSTNTAADRQEFIGLRLRENSEGGHLDIRPVCSVWLPDRSGPDADLQRIRKDGNYSFNFTYDPDPDLTLFPKSDGRLSITITGPDGYHATASIDDIGRRVRTCGAQYDAFGIGAVGGQNSEDDADKHINVFLDDVSYTGFVGKPLPNRVGSLHRHRARNLSGFVGPFSVMTGQTLPRLSLLSTGQPFNN